MSRTNREGQETKLKEKIRRDKMLSEQSLTDTDQQKATEKPNQDGRQEIKRKNKNKKGDALD